MSSQVSPAAPKAPRKRGKIVAVALSTVLLGLIAIFLIPKPPAKNCEFYSDESTTNTNKPQAVVVLAPTSNFVDFSSVATRAKGEITAALGLNLADQNIAEAKGRELSIVLGDGAPALIVHSMVIADSNDAMDIRRAINETTFGTIELSVLCSAGDYKKPGDEISTTSETDLLKSLEVAAAQLNTSGPRDIFILGNGIQTAGAIQMQESGSFPKTEKLATRFAMSLFQKGAIPDLAGARVHWYGLGQVDGVTQKSLPNAYGTSLRTFWSEIIRLGGGNLTDVCSECGTGKPTSKAIYVHSVNVTSCNLIVELYEDDGVEFKPDSTEFISSAKALHAAKSTVSKFNQKKCDSVTITGFAAAAVPKDEYLKNKSAIDATNSSLTMLRAQAFGRLLKEAGFSGEVTSVGGGTCGTEWAVDGQVDPKQQKLCRRVEVTS